MSIQSFTDHELVALYLTGNEKGLETLLHRHKSKLFSSILVIVKDRALAEDVFQDTFLKVIQTLKKGQYNEEGKFLPWVYRISHNLIIDHFRRIKKMPPASIYYNEEGEEIHPLDKVSDTKDVYQTGDESSKRKNNIRDLVHMLPPDQREVVIMRTYYDMSFKEIADTTNVSINTSLGRMRYALINLKKMIEERKVEVSF
ncbi:MAG: sigma-70 family RNA polymerase sigma factor [Bacteroidota bacterium]|nr:sigma-70 family RNA polymerase sigma factor [Bacteroidota bacterium]